MPSAAPETTWRSSILHGTLLPLLAIGGMMVCGCSSKVPPPNRPGPDVRPASEAKGSPADGKSHTLETRTVHLEKVCVANDGLFLSPDGQQLVVHATDADDKDVLICKGKTLGPYDLLPETPVFGPHGKLIVCLVSNSTSEKTLVVNGVAQGTFQQVDWPPVFSDDGGNYAFVTCQDEKSRVVVNGKPQAVYDYVKELQFRPGGSEVAYIAVQEGRRFVVIGDQPGKKYSQIRDLSFCPARNAFAYVANQGQDAYGDGGTWYRVVGQDEGRPFPEFSSGAFLLDATGQCVAYTHASGSSMRVVWRGKEGKTYDVVSGLVGSADGSTIAYHAKAGLSECIVMGTREGTSYQGNVSLPMPIPGSASFAYTVEIPAHENTPSSQFVVVDGVEQKRYQRVADLGFWLDGKTLAYRAFQDGETQQQRNFSNGHVQNQQVIFGGSWCYVVGGTPLESYPDIGVELRIRSTGHTIHGSPFSMGGKSYVLIDSDPTTKSELTGLPFFSPHRRHYAYLAKSEEGLRVILDGKAGTPYEQVTSMVFSPREDRVAYAVRHKSECFVVEGGEKGEAFDEVSNPVYLDDDTLLYFGFSTQRLYAPGTLYRVVRKWRP